MTRPCSGRCVRALAVALAGPLTLAVPAWGGAQEPAAPSAADTAAAARDTTARISVEWMEVPVGDVLRTFADFAGKSIVAGPEVAGPITAFIDDQPWDVALAAILSAHGYEAAEDEHGIIRVRGPAAAAPPAQEALVTRAYRLSFAKASELLGTLAPHLSEAGTISVAESTNTLIITDFESVHRVIAGLLR